MMSNLSISKTISDRKIESLCLYIVGVVLLSISLSMIPCLMLSMFFKEEQSMILIPMLIGLMLGSILIMFCKLPKVASRVNVLFMLGALWLTVAVFGAVPYMFSGIDFCSAIFESMSGYTTTGGSAIADLSVFTQGMLFYRVTTNWVGGIIIIISVMILLPMVGSGNRTVISNEISGSGGQNMMMRIKDVAIQFIQIYIALSIMMCVILIWLSMDPLDAISITFSTISTGGFSSKPMTDYNVFVDFVITLFMFLGATNFYLHFRAAMGKKLGHYKRNEEFVMMGLWYLFASTVIFFTSYVDAGLTIDNFVHSMLMVVSAGTTTGFACTDYTPWPAGAVMLIFIVAIVGGSTGSTAGGIKVARAIIFFKHIRNHIADVSKSHVKRPVTLNGRNVSNDDVHSAILTIFLFLFTIVLFSVIFMSFGLGMAESVTAVVTSITNYGPGVNAFGPMSSFADIDPILKLLMALIMWLGRLEVSLAIVLFLPSVWKEQIRSVKYTHSH